ncbi:MAG: polysaccharide pyruvyl transferase family protein [Clostridiales Family XIII bacterium]|jgi:hypothetical protein|nr:polysaccharide pyruvyl transferase family protein [Clostridiales Family XIII bacterium]
MKKIGLLTLVSYTNFGNRLQNYALQEVLRGFGFAVDTIAFKDRASETPQTLVGRLKKLRGKSPDEMARIVIYHLFEKKRRLQNIEKTEQAFKIFICRHIAQRELDEVDFAPGGTALFDYACFVTGSDQVWNPQFGFREVFFLTFAEEGKRIAYAPSFGLSQLPEEWRGRFARWLDGIPHLSVREREGAAIIRELTGRDAPVLIDPTLLIDAAHWRSLAQTPASLPDGAFLLTLFWGGQTKRDKRLIDRFAKRRRLKIMRLDHSHDLHAGPQEFLRYVDAAALVCTDSFHGTAFAILFETPFVAFQGVTHVSAIFSRLETLLETFAFQSRKADCVDWDGDVCACDFSHVPAILREERRKANDFLKNALAAQEDGIREDAPHGNAPHTGADHGDANR